MNFELPKIYPITDSRLSGLSHADQVKRLILGGAKVIQLREKYASPKDFYKSAEDAIKIARENDIKIIINDRVDIALALRADGVHLGQDDLPPEKARKILGEKSIIGFSTHSLEQAVKAANFPINYIAIGPVFTTKTKHNPEKKVGLKGVKKVRESIGDFPLVAIGGINSENYLEALKAGADSVAMISDIISQPEKISQNIRKYSFM